MIYEQKIGIMLKTFLNLVFQKRRNFQQPATYLKIGWLKANHLDTKDSIKQLMNVQSLKAIKESKQRKVKQLPNL